jgi:hypothetical protein
MLSIRVFRDIIKNYLSILDYFFIFIFIFIFLYPLYYTTYNTTHAASRL